MQQEGETEGCKRDTKGFQGKTDGLRAMPPKVSVGYKTIEIVCREIDDGAGMYQTDRRRISIASDQHPDERVNTLLHEILHAVYEVYGLKPGDSEEEVVSSIANGLTEVWLQNPDITEFIWAELGEQRAAMRP